MTRSGFGFSSAAKTVPAVERPAPTTAQNWRRDIRMSGLPLPLVISSFYLACGSLDRIENKENADVQRQTRSRKVTRPSAELFDGTTRHYRIVAIPIIPTGVNRCSKDARHSP
jgi:hypothetical protein